VNAIPILKIALGSRNRSTINVGREKSCMETDQNYKFGIKYFFILYIKNNKYGGDANRDRSKLQIWYKVFLYSIY
jgi:hypothetical protein